MLGNPDWSVKSFLCLLSRRRRKPSRKLQCEFSRKGKENRFHKIEFIIYRLGPWGPKRSKFCPQPLCSAFPKSFPKSGISSRIDQTSSCAVRCKAAKIKCTTRAVNCSFPRLPVPQGSSQPCPPAACERTDTKIPVFLAMAHTGLCLFSNY